MKPLVVSKCENMDIEQNPGPSNHINLQENASVLLQGGIHQGDEIFSPDSRGHQCLPCCLVFLVKAVQKRICTNMWNVNNMNEILFAGDKLHEYPFLDLETTLAMNMQSSLDVHLIEFLKKVFFSGSTMPRCLIYFIEIHLMV